MAEQDDARNERSDTVRAVVRALALLHAMNQRPLWTLLELHRVSGLPKATLSRLLATLIQEGYVVPEAAAGTYRLTAKVQELGSGYTERARLVDLARPVILEVTRQIKWPLALGMLDCDAIVVRFSSMPYSPLAVHTTTLGHRLGLVDTAMGRVFLAFCSDIERESLLANLRAPAAGGIGGAADWIRRDLARIRVDGYGVRQPGVTRGSASLAVPVLMDGQAVAVLAMTTFGRAMTRSTIDRHVPVLTATAHRVAGAFRDDTRRPD